MKKFSIVSIVCIVIVVTLLTAFVGCRGNVERSEVDLTFDNLGGKPSDEVASKVQHIDYSSLTFSEEMTDDKAVLDSIVQIIDISNKNNMNLDFYAAAAYGTGDAKINFTGDKKIVGSMDTREFRVYDNGEYFFDTYGLVVDGYTLASDGRKGSVPSTLINVLAAVLDFADRVYSPDGKTFYKSENGKPSNDCFLKYPSLDAVSYKSPKTQVYTLEQYNKNNYYKNSYREYTSDNIEYEEYLKKGSLTYDKEKGIYYITAEVNCDNEIALELSIASMKESSGTDIFKYAGKTLVLEVWDCGLLKNYINKNVWEATLLPDSLKLQGSSENFYEQRFVYDKEYLEKMIVPDSVKQTLMNG